MHEIITDSSRFNAENVGRLLKQTYWANNRSRDAIARSLRHSLCFGIFDGNELVAFARATTDLATMYYLSDVIVDEKLRGNGLGKELVRAVTSGKRLRRLRGILATRDAQGLYSKYGFTPFGDRGMTRNPTSDPQIK